MSARHANSAERRNWIVRLLSAFAFLSLALALAEPATAHEKHKKKPEQAQQVQRQQPASAGGQVPAAEHTGAGHGQAGEMMDGMDMGMDRSSMSFAERLLDWFGRLHPMIVHFPIAFFPAALFTAVVGRRQPAFSAPVQFLVVAGGIFAPIAAIAGWFAGLGADPEAILTYHRWLGVAIGLAGAGLGVWAWRRPWEDRGGGMILALTVMTVAIAVQGFLGAGVTHGIEHLMF
ncbi:hypothetical protein H8M03_03150 [Sphingomonas sabuli]|uniref:DUF2231 domain-containing protein n=1 Tax=Sphingomonas sabuli TaxID=2764186 RepID=A0A7G9L409_9SPHN|nr:DUF2231 domain-containing protein [Sphingomonas sabuli]QNM83358.1 hypothetical protein H8M03_03150 [Sphingomonas sabuli]